MKAIHALRRCRVPSRSPVPRRARGSAPTRRRRTDRLTLDTFLEMETVVGSAAVTGRRADHLHPRLGRQDERQPRVGALDHECRRQPQPLPREGLRRALVADRRSDRLHGDRRTARIADLRPLDGRRRRDLAGHARRAVAVGASRGRQTAIALSFTALVEERNNWPIKMPKAPAGAKWTEAPRIVERLNYRRDRSGFTDNGYRHIIRRAGDRRHAAADHVGQLRSQRQRVDARRQEHPLQRPSRRDRRLPVA